MRPDIRESLIAYAREGRETGGFLRAVLENDLMEAVARADVGNLHDLQEIASFIYNCLPSVSHGSPERVEAYLEAIRTDADLRANVERNFAMEWSRNWCERCCGSGRIEFTECEACEGRGYLLPPGPDTNEERRGDR